jgi:hypothetical protein
MITRAEQLKQNEAEGYNLVTTLSNGLDLYKKKNGAGGWSYYGESTGIFGLVWDTCLGSKEELIAVAQDAYNLNVWEED